jgi:hypothetical protein
MRQLRERTKPLRPELCDFFASEVVSELPNMRAQAAPALSKALHFLKMRSMPGSTDETVQFIQVLSQEVAKKGVSQLLLNQTRNPLKVKVSLPRPIDKSKYTNGFLNSMKCNISAEDSGKPSVMFSSILSSQLLT